MLFRRPAAFRRRPGPDAVPDPPDRVRRPSPPPLACGSTRCHCGALLDHPWPGKPAGAPHPKET